MRNPLRGVAVAGAVLAVGVWAPAAQAWFGPGVFSCRASGFRVTYGFTGLGTGTIEPDVVASTPCVDGSDTVGTIDIPLQNPFVTLTALTGVIASAQTLANAAGSPGGEAKSSVGAAVVNLLGGLGDTISVQSASAQADSRCRIDTTPSSPYLYGSSSVVGVRIDGGAPITTSAPETIALPGGGGTLYLNRTVTGPGATIAQQALSVVPTISLAEEDSLVLAEATADVESCG